MNLDQIFSYESLTYHYEKLQLAFINSNSTNRKKKYTNSKKTPDH